MKLFYKKLTRLFITAVLLIGFADLSFGQTIIISEVADPGNTANAKFVEIYNATSSSVNISGWQIRRYANGGTTPTNATIPTTTNLASGDTYVIAYNTSDFNTAYGFDPDQTSSAISGNGDDVYELYNGSSVVDIYGEVGVDGTGEAWEYVDSQAERNSSVCSGNTTWTASEWTITSANTGDMSPGTHTCDCPSSNDSDSEASTPTGGQQAAGNISSLVDTDGEAVNVFKFDINDTDNGDTEDTKVTNIRIKPHTSNNADWTDHIQGIKLSGSTLGAITITTTTITDTHIDLAITSGNLDVPNSTSETMTMSLYLNTSNIVDGAVLSFMIDYDDHGFTADASGSTFASSFGSADITSNNFTITVVATELRFVQQPLNTIAGNCMASDVSVESTDVNGNRDTDFNTDIRITSSGTLDGTPVIVTASSGLAAFSGADCIKHNATGTNLTLTAQRDVATPDWDKTSNTFNITSGIDVTGTDPSSVDFEAGTNDNIVYRLQTDIAGLDRTLTDVTADISSTSGNLNVFVGNYKLRYSTDATLEGGDATLATVGATAVNPETITFTGLSQSLTAGSSYYLFITTDVLSSATIAEHLEIDETNVSVDFTGSPIPESEDYQAANAHEIIASSESDIITVASSESATVSSIENTAGPLTSVQGTQVWQITIRDGGAGSDADNVATVVNSITISQNAGNAMNDWDEAILSCDIFDGSTHLDQATVTSNQIQFSGSPLIFVPDNGSVTLTIRLSISTAPNTSGNNNDGDDFVFNIINSNVSTASTGSGFSSFTLANSANGNNVFEVIATELNFVQEPTDTNVNATMSPAVTAEATDANGNRDLDNASTVSLSSSNIMIGVSDITLSNGFGTFGNIIHTVSGANLVLTAATAGLSNATSANFDITEDISSEDFSSCPSTVWNAVDVVGSTDVWTCSGGVMEINGYGDEDDEDWLIIASSINFNNYSNEEMTFVSQEKYDGPNLELYYSTDFSGTFDASNVGSATWILISHTWNDVSSNSTYSSAYDNTVDLSGLSGTAYIAFKYTGTSSLAEGWLLDNIEITGISTSCSEPTTNASVIIFSSVATTSMTVGWTSGDGSNRIVVAKQGAAPDWSPTDTNTYNADASFGSGTELGTGNYVVYNGTGNTVDITNLTPGTSYYFKIFEYNCGLGNEDYLVDEDALTGSQTTLLSNVQNLNASCVTETTVTLDWDAPAGSYDGILVTVRQGAVPHLPTCADGSTYTSANTDYTLAPTYCSSVSKYVYNGTGNTVTVTALTNSSSYTFKVFTYQGSDWSTGTQTTKTVDLIDVSNANATRGNAEVDLSWTHPANCFDEIMIVAKDTTTNSTITASPSGDGTSYTANSVFSTGGSGANLPSNEFCVYKGTGTNLTVTGLTNGNTYEFKIFVRKGTEWTDGVEVFEKPMDITIIEPGDLMIMAVNTNYDNDPIIDPGQPLGYFEEFTFVCFQAIKVGTPIDFTDNGWERQYTGKWGTTEGSIRLTRTAGGTLAAGTTVTVVMNYGSGGGTTAAHFDVFVAGVDELALATPRWSITELNTTDGSGFNLNSEDDIWIMQNGSWVENTTGGAPDPAYHDDDYTGNILFGWTATGWPGADAAGSTAFSNLYPYSDCFQTDISGASNNDKVKYSGDLTSSATQLEWIARVNDSGNWTTYSSDVLYDATTTNLYRQSGFTLPITAGGYTAGVWTGTQNTDWFDCGNWQSLTVPDETIDVVIGASATDSVDVKNSSSEAAKYGGIAKCNNLTISNKALLLESSVNDTLEIYGNLTINSGGVLDMDDAAKAIDGHLYLYGNWNNQAGEADFKQGEGTIHLVGTGTQSISTNSFTEIFYNVVSDNSFVSGILLSDDIQIDGELTHTDGDIDLNGNNIELRGIYSRTTGTFIGDATSNFSLNNSGTVADLYFINDFNLNNFTINRASENVNIISDLSINNNLTISAGSMTLAAGQDYDVSGTLINSAGTNGLVIKSDASGTASLIHSTANIPATVERYLSGNYWHYIFAPLTAIDTSTFTLVSWGDINPNYYWYDETVADYWNGLTVYIPTGWTRANSISSQYMQTDRGYIHRFTSDKVFIQTGGNLDVSNKTFSLTLQDNTTPVTPHPNYQAPPVWPGWDKFDGWNLIGNPYVAAIDWNAIPIGNKTNIDNYIYYYDDINEQYLCYGGAPPWSNNGVAINGGTQYIPAGQSVMVKATANGNFTIPASVRVHSDQAFYKGNKDVIPDLLRFQIEKDNYTDETVIRTLEDATNEHDASYDAHKMFVSNNDRPQIYTNVNENSVLYAVNSLPTITENKLVPVAVRIGLAGEYTIRFTENNFDNMHIWFEDVLLNKTINLSYENIYTFSQSAQLNDDRFYVHFGNNTKPILNIEIPDQETDVDEYYSFDLPENVFIDLDFEDELSLSASLSSGDDLPEWLTFDSDLEQFSGTPDEVQTLNIKVTATDIFGENISDEFVLNVKNAVSVSNISENIIFVYPNPTTGKIVVEMTGKNISGIIKVTDINGQELINTNINSDRTEIDLSKLASGIYFIEIISNNYTHRERIIKK
ncbi:MAG: lamin tail domain-containing protein [Bacteroidales bacterium]|nr:lamin tail domain-containing protein [Bacteroidales bacterium]